MKKILLCAIAIVMILPVITVDALTPPSMVSFYSEEAIRELMDAELMSDEELEHFLKTGDPERGYPESYAFHGIRSRGNVNKFATPLRMIGYPYMKDKADYDNAAMTYYPNTGDYFFACRIDGIQYRFEYRIAEERIDREGMEPVGEYEIDGAKFSMFQIDNRLVGEFYKEDYQIQAIVKDYATLDEVTFQHFGWRSDQEPEPVTVPERNLLRDILLWSIPAVVILTAGGLWFFLRRRRKKEVSPA